MQQPLSYVLYQLSFYVFTLPSASPTASTDSPECRSAADRFPYSCRRRCSPKGFLPFSTPPIAMLVPRQSLRIEGNLIILIEHVRNIDTLRTVGRAVTACGTWHTLCHLFCLGVQRLLLSVVHRRVRLSKMRIFSCICSKLDIPERIVTTPESTAGNERCFCPACRLDQRAASERLHDNDRNLLFV